MGEVFGQYTDTTGNYHYSDTETGQHVIIQDGYINDRDDRVKDTQTQPNTTGRITAPTNYAEYGWICPVCGRGLSPYTAVCPCKNGKGWEITC